MFQQANLEKIKSRMEKAVSELYETAIQNQKNSNDIVLFYSNAHLGQAVPGVCGKFMVGPGIEGIDDYPRVQFLIDYLQSGNESIIQPSWSQEEIEKHKKYTINLELMIYTHLWEAERSLKTLKQLANLIQGKAYQWEIDIPWMTKHDFIRNEIKQVFLDHNLDIGKLIQESYHSQLRNAFAHGNYTFHESNHIKLNNYRGESWELKAISLDDWEDRFLKSALLHYEILFQRHRRLEEFGAQNPEVTVWLPKDNGTGYYRSVLTWFDVRKEYVWKR